MQLGYRRRAPPTPPGEPSALRSFPPNQPVTNRYRPTAPRVMETEQRLALPSLPSSHGHARAKVVHVATPPNVARPPMRERLLPDRGNATNPV